MGWFCVFGTGGGRIQWWPEPDAGWETEILPMGLAGTAVVLPMGLCRNEPAGQEWAMAEMGFHSHPLCLHECGRTSDLPA